MRKKILKIIAVCIAIIMMTGILAACSSSGKEPGKSENTGKQSTASSDNKTKPVTIKFANYAMLEKGYEPFWTKVKKDFESSNPGVTIEWVTAPYGEIMQQVITRAAGGDKVDLFFGEIGWLPGMISSGIISPVNNFFDKAYIDDFYPSVLSALSEKDDIYAIPMYITPYILYYNKDLFKAAGLDPAKPPKTYNEMMTYAEKLSQLKDKDGNKIYAFGQTTASVPISGSSLCGFMFNFGGGLFDEAGNVIVNSAENKAAFTMLQNIYKKGYTPENAKLKDLRNLFAIGRLAMYYDQAWGFNGVNSINPDAANFTASSPALATDKTNGTSILESNLIMMMNNGDDKVKAAAKLVEYVTSAEVLGDYLKNTTPAYPPRKSLANIEAVTANNIIKGAAEAVGNVKPQFKHPELTNVYLEVSSAAQAVTVGGQTPDKAIADLDAKLKGMKK